MSELTLEYGGKIHAGKTWAQLAEIGIPLGEIARARKAQALSQIATFADQYRERLFDASAVRMREQEIRAEIARDQSSASAEELALLTREADAKGIDLATLIGQIQTQDAAAREITLLIGVIEVEARAAIAAIPDNAADIEADIQTALAAAKAQAETAFVQADALINGGS